MVEALMPKKVRLLWVMLIFLCALTALPVLAQAPEVHRGPARQDIVIQQPADEPLVIPASIIWKALGATGLAVLALAGLVWKAREKDIDTINKDLRGKVDECTYEENRKEMMEADERLRLGIIECHKKIELADSRAQDRHNQVMQAILDLKR
jgi:hypothetical protein